MSVFNRIEIVNFLNMEDVSPSSREWHPHWRGVPLVLGGVSTAIKLVNGGGKTSICDAIYALLTRKPDLVTATRERCAGKAFGYYTHIRLEVTYETRIAQQPRLIGHEVEGEHYVFGLFGTVDELSFYHYKGRLEDLPVMHHEGSRQIVVPNREFDQQRKGMSMLCDPGTRREQWIQHVHDHIDAHTLGKAAEYHAKGGGDGAKALFQVTRTPGGRYDTDFFYEHIAPEVLVGCMQDDGEPDEFRFEDTLVNSALPLVEAERKLRRKKSEHKDWEALYERLSDANSAVERYRNAQRERQRVAALHLSEARWLRDVVLTQPLPGVPASLVPGLGFEQMRFIADRMVVSDGQWLVPDSLLAELTSETTSAINQRCDRQGHQRHRLSSQVIENPCDSFSVSGKRGPQNSGYGQSAAVRLALEATKFAEGWDRAGLQRALNYAFEAREGAGECNPFRLTARQAGREKHALGARLTAAENDEASADAELVTVTTRLELLDVAEAELRRMEASGLFSADELRAPISAAEAVRNEQQALQHKLIALQQRRIALAPGRVAYYETTAEFRNEAPDAALTRLQTRRQDASAFCESAKAQEALARNQLQTAAAEVEARREAVEALLRVHAELERLQPKVQQFIRVFGQEEWRGLRERIEAEYRDLMKKRALLEANLLQGASLHDELCRLREAAREFASIFGDESVEGLAARVTKELAAAEREQERLEGVLNRLALTRSELIAGETSYASIASRFGNVDVHSLEKSLRNEERSVRSERAAIGARIEHLSKQVAYLDEFAIEFGEAQSPTEVRDARSRESLEVGTELARLKGRLAERQRDIEELLSGGTAAGPLARQALQITSARLRVHEVVSALALPDSRLRDVLSQLSQVLHAPVYEDQIEAVTALHLLEEAQIDYPVFNRVALEAFCQNDEATSVALLWGRQSAAVMALVDPSTVPARIAQAEEECVVLKHSAGELESSLASLAPTSPQGGLIENACRADEEKARTALAAAKREWDAMSDRLGELESTLVPELSEQIGQACLFLTAGGGKAIVDLDASAATCRDALDAVEATLPALQRRAAPESMELIDRQFEFVSRGGLDGLARLADQLESLALTKSDADERLAVIEEWHVQLDVVDAKVQFEELGGAERFAGAQAEIESARMAATTAEEHRNAAGQAYENARILAEAAVADAYTAALELSTWESRLNQAASYAADGGVQFDETFDDGVLEANQALDLCTKKLEIRFELAQQGLETRGGAGDRSAVLARRAELVSKITSLTIDIGDVRRKMDELRDVVTSSDQSARKLDASVSMLLSAWKDAAAVIEALRGELSFPPGEVDSLLLRAVKQLADEVRTQGDAELVGTMDEIAGNLAGFEFRKGLAKVEEWRREERNAISAARREAKRIAEDKASKLATYERTLIDPDRNDRDDALMSAIEQLHGIAYEQVHKLSEMIRSVDEDVRKHRERLYVSMSGFTRQIRDNFKLLKQMLKPEEGSAGLLIEADVVNDDQIDAAARQVVDIIREDLDLRDNSAYRMTVQTEGEQKRHKQALRDRIGKEFYRAVFVGPAKSESGPIVKLQHPAIAAGKARPLKQSLSVGQKNAVFLMAIVKLADFAQERDAMRDGGSRRRVRPSRVLMIDGLFSNLSDPRLIRPALEVLKLLRGQFQLIGWIHYPQYENDPTLFPSFVQLRQAGRERGFIVKGEEIVDGRIVPVTLRVEELPRPAA